VGTVYLFICFLRFYIKQDPDKMYDLTSENYTDLVELSKNKLINSALFFVYQCQDSGKQATGEEDSIRYKYRSDIIWYLQRVL
jgi:hypothetical protein